MTSLADQVDAVMRLDVERELAALDRGAFDIDHTAATPPGLVVDVDVECTAVEGRKVSFNVKAHDGVDQIGAGRHERFVVAWDRFNAKVADKAKAAAAKATV